MTASVSPPGSYPGVYVKPIIEARPPTGGVATSIAAFIGRTPRGPVNVPVQVLDYGSYERSFGGLASDSPVSYQAHGFFNNGGAQAEVVRLYRMPAVSIRVDIKSAADGRYTLDFSPLLGGPTVSVETPEDTSAGQAAAALVQALEDAPLLQGQVANAKAQGSSLTFDLSYASVVSGLGPNTSVELKLGRKGPGDAAYSDPADSVETGTGAAAVEVYASKRLTITGKTVASSNAAIPLGPSSSSSSSRFRSFDDDDDDDEDDDDDDGSSSSSRSSSSSSSGSSRSSGAASASAQAPAGEYLVELVVPGARPIRVSYQSPEAAAPSDVASGLAAAINGNKKAARFVSASASGADLDLSYRAQVTIEAEGPTNDAIEQQDGDPVLVLLAANPGSWGRSLTVSVDRQGINAAVAARFPGLIPDDLFNLTAIFDDGSSATSERFTAVTLKASAGANRLDRVLEHQSNLIRLGAQQLDGPTPPAGAFGTGNDEGVDSDPLADVDYIGNAASMSGLYAFNRRPRAFNIMCIPPDGGTTPGAGDTGVDVYQEAAQVCVDNNAMLILDPPQAWQDAFEQGQLDAISLAALGNYSAEQGRSCAVYFPRVVIADPLRNGRPKTVVGSGFIAAAWASTDTAVGVWKAPAGLDAPIGGILGLSAQLDDAQNGVLNPEGINVLRTFSPGGTVVWGARTLRGADALADEYKYVPVRRLLDYIESSLLEDTRWAVFQPNGLELWAKPKNQVTTFMSRLFSQGAFAGTSVDQAFFVKCDASTTTPADQAAGIVNVQVGFAPIDPAEFVVITISQLTPST